MGRKKKKVEKPWCWYCNRDFEDEKILIQHQKAKHFKCHMCHKKLFSGPGLAIHCMQVHKETIDKIPGAVQGRDSTEVEIYGMSGMPQDASRGAEYDEGPSAKKARPDGPTGGIPMPPMMPGMMPPPFPMPPFGMPPFPPPPGMPGMPPPAGMPPPFIPPPFMGGRGGGPPIPPPPWARGPLGPPPPGMPPHMPPQQISGQSTVPQSYSERLAQERSERAPIPDGPLHLGGGDHGYKNEPPHDDYAQRNPPVVAQLSAKIRIVHPDDHNVSLEERRLQLMASRSSSSAAGYHYR